MRATKTRGNSGTDHTRSVPPGIELSDYGFPINSEKKEGSAPDDTCDEYESSATPTVPARTAFRRFWPMTKGLRRWLVAVWLCTVLGALAETRPPSCSSAPSPTTRSRTARWTPSGRRPPSGSPSPRALLHDAPVLVLDEPTTGLDAIASRRIVEPLRRLMAGRTTIVITHDLDLAPDADRILVIDQGRVTETGRHDELLALGGTYAHLCSSRKETSAGPAEPFPPTFAAPPYTVFTGPEGYHYGGQAS